MGEKLGCYLVGWVKNRILESYTNFSARAIVLSRKHVELSIV
jgi:hypothetical protein